MGHAATTTTLANCIIKIRRDHVRHNNVDFKSNIIKTSSFDIKQLSIVVSDEGYDSEENHVLVREHLKSHSIIPPRYQHVPVWKTHGRSKTDETRLFKDTI